METQTLVIKYLDRNAGSKTDTHLIKYSKYNSKICFQKQQQLCRNSNILYCFENKPYQNVDKRDIADSVIHSNLINQCINNLKQHELYNANYLKEEKICYHNSTVTTITITAIQAPLSGRVTSFNRFLLHLPEAESCSAYNRWVYKGEEWVPTETFLFPNFAFLKSVAKNFNFF